MFQKTSLGGFTGVVTQWTGFGGGGRGGGCYGVCFGFEASVEAVFGTFGVAGVVCHGVVVVRVGMGGFALDAA